MLSLGRARNKILLPDPMYKLNINVWLWLLVWIKQLLQELKFCEVEQMKYCDNHAILHIASNLGFHERFKLGD